MGKAAASFIGSGGYALLDDIEEQIEQRKEASGEGKMWRFFMKEGEERRVVFLTDDPPIIEEHNLQLNGKFGNHFTCLRHPALGGKCPLCEAGDRAQTVGFYVVLDRTGYTNKKGEKVKDVIRVLPAKFKSLKQFKKYSQKYGGLVGVEFEVSRTNGKAASIGDVWVKEEKHDADELDAIIAKVSKDKALDELVPDWEDYLKPRSAKELAALVGGKTGGSGGGSASSGKKSSASTESDEDGEGSDVSFD